MPREKESPCRGSVPVRRGEVPERRLAEPSALCATPARAESERTRDGTQGSCFAPAAGVRTSGSSDTGPCNGQRGPEPGESRRMGLGGERRASFPLFAPDGLLRAQQSLHQPGQQHFLRSGLVGHRAERVAAGQEGGTAAGPAVHRGGRDGLALAGGRPVLREVHAQQRAQRADEDAARGPGQAHPHRRGAEERFRPAASPARAGAAQPRRRGRDPGGG